MHIFLFILIFLILILVLGLSIVGAILRAVFGIGRRSSSQPKKTGYEYTNQQQRTGNNQSSNTSSNPEEEMSAENGQKNHKKIFTKEEGEYVDYEEIR